MCGHTKCIHVQACTFLRAHTQTHKHTQTHSKKRHLHAHTYEAHMLKPLGMSSMVLRLSGECKVNVYVSKTRAIC